MNRLFIFSSFGAGLLLAAVGFAKLRGSGEALRHDRNPFAIQQSGYGKTLARLSQDTIDVVWHLGIEQVNPIGHDHGHGDEDDHHAADGAGEGSLAEGAPAPAEHHEGWLEQAKDWLQDLRAARYERNSPFAISEAHQKAVSADLENMLLRGYKMDPTDYGVYNSYFLFLTIHKMRATPISRDHARLVSRMTVAHAMKEDVDPQPWLTACMATLNLFFLDLEDARAKGESLPAAALEDYRRQMAHCLQGFAVLKEKAIAEGRWEKISQERRESMRERERFALMASEQFDTLLARAEAPASASAGGEGEAEKVHAPAGPPVAAELGREGAAPLAGEDAASER